MFLQSNTIINLFLFLKICQSRKLIFFCVLSNDLKNVIEIAIAKKQIIVLYFVDFEKSFYLNCIHIENVRDKI